MSADLSPRVRSEIMATLHGASPELRKLWEDTGPAYEELCISVFLYGYARGMSDFRDVTNDKPPSELFAACEAMVE